MSQVYYISKKDMNIKIDIDIERNRSNYKNLLDKDLKTSIDVTTLDNIYKSELVEYENNYKNLIQGYPELSKKIEGYNVTEKEKKGLKLFCHRFINSKIVNAVCPIYTSNPIDLDRIERTCIKYNLAYKRYPKFTGMPVKFKYKDLNFTAVFFKSGRINVIGLRGDSNDYLEKVLSSVCKYEIELLNSKGVSEGKRHIANKVYSVSIPKLIPLDLLYLFNKISDWRSVKYNNQSFPGVIKKSASCNAKILFFKTGSSIITGVRSDEHKLQILNEFLDLLVEYLSLRQKVRLL